MVKHPFSAAAAFCTAVVLFSGCILDPGDSDNDTPLETQPSRLFVLESDFQSGKVEWIATATAAVENGGFAVYHDALIRSYGGHVYILEKFGADNIIKFDPALTDEEGILYQVHLGDNWNPVDIEFSGDTKAYIANQEEPEITIFDPSAGKATGAIDISAYTFNPDSNSSPHANRMVLVDGMLYVMLQRRNGWDPGAATLILVIDTGSDEIADTIACVFANGNDMALAGGALYVTNPGNALVAGDGAIEKIDLASKEVSTVITEDELGGNPNQICHIEGSRFYVQNYVGWEDVRVMEIDVSDGSIVETLPEIKDAFGGICYDSVDGILYVGERNAAGPGVRVFKNNEQVTGPLHSDNSLPPAGMVVVR
jgi:DNA-binding beta-propeller fold protein YncE